MDVFLPILNISNFNVFVFPPLQQNMHKKASKTNEHDRKRQQQINICQVFIMQRISVQVRLSQLLMNTVVTWTGSWVWWSFRKLKVTSCLFVLGNILAVRPLNTWLTPPFWLWHTNMTVTVFHFIFIWIIIFFFDSVVNLMRNSPWVFHYGN